MRNDVVEAFERASRGEAVRLEDPAYGDARGLRNGKTGDGKPATGTSTFGPQRRGSAGRPSRRHIAPAGLITAAAFCAAAGAVTVAVGGPAAAPVAGTTAFDGHYGGPLVAAEGRGDRCVRRWAVSDVVVRGGRALAYIEGYGPALHGPVQAGGSAEFRGALLEGPARMTGRFEGGRFVGELRGWWCTYAVELARQS